MNNKITDSISAARDHTMTTDALHLDLMPTIIDLMLIIIILNIIIRILIDNEEEVNITLTGDKWAITDIMRHTMEQDQEDILHHEAILIV